MDKKKKYIIAAVAFVICAIMFTFAIKAERLYSESLMNKQSTSQEIGNKSSSSSDNKQKSNKDSSSKNSNEKITVKQGDPEENNSFQFIDTVHRNNVFLRKDVNNMDGQTVGYITEKLLDEAKINYKCTGSVSTIYFAAINGLYEKKAGRLSGWCYYVRKKGQNKFVKPNVGSGQWIYHTGDIVVWKYLQDGIHDGYSDNWK
ncbi:DUF4430 domain-containing protein [Clostridium sp. AWRP]|nr:DUF4430 domain-containing protein [Clostridium sp. AWRP]